MNTLGVWVECDSFHFILVEFLTISHPRVYHKYILLLKSIQMKNDVPFSNPNWKIVLGPTCNWGKIWIWLLWAWKFSMWYRDLSSFQFHGYDLIWMSQQKFIANIPKLLIFVLSRRAHLYCIPHVQYFVYVYETSTTNTMVYLLSYATSLTQFGCRIPHIWHFSQEQMF